MNVKPSALAPRRIVAIGGGTGLSTLLHGLKRYARAPYQNDAGPMPAIEITAVVTVTDDGGSSGRLRREFDVLPPGDIRNCLVALSEDEALLSRLFQYRFSNGRGLKGHTFGNLFLTAMTNLTGDFPQAVKLSSEVLTSFGRIYPSTAANVVLEARLEDGATVAGETRISRSRSRIRKIALKPRSCKPLPETLDAIANADLITLGPGSLYTSVIPNLLVDGIPDAIRRSAAVKAYFVNLMWQPGETINYTAAQHVEAIQQHAGDGLIDCVVVNTRPVSPRLLRRYALERAGPVENDLARLAALGVKVVGRDLLQESTTIRHDPDATAAVALELAGAGRRRRRKLLTHAT
jgi:uncharacterized cofD-like protein